MMTIVRLIDMGPVFLQQIMWRRGGNYGTCNYFLLS